jgi:hypothetical protein
MKRVKFLWMAGLLMAGASLAQGPGAPNLLAGSPKVEIKGRIQSVQLSQGQGTPYLEVQTGSAVTRGVLGAGRYLMEQNFNPKAGAEVAVKGFKAGADVYAITVTLVAEGKLLRLRAEDGRPLWQGGRFGRGRGGR